METNPGIILQRMGVEVGPDDPRSSQEILNQINRNRIEDNLLMEPNPEIRSKMAAFALKTYPLKADESTEERLPKRKSGSPYMAF